ncbi:resolvase [Haloferax mucosum ATCC BAA-1512]|uniref:Resolvase n=1 Tax=Haloferax mucosum ATCC BAA-1512 TaxID=662479 RepID=M0IJR8_9EURY|nr:recombinase family protein [Haloferax mucosum]ELZ96093.1 resolvase [Haloferax mucosum ATCC BAA-1512]
MIACYTRVSTTDQNLDRQIDATQQYARETFGVGLDELEVYRDKSTGTETNRSAYKRMMSDASDHDDTHKFGYRICKRSSRHFLGAHP